MIKVDQLLKDMKYLVINRETTYNNTFPYNCGYLFDDGILSFDCIGLIKTYINDPGIVYKTAPAGSWITPGLVIPDLDEIGILNQCDKVTWNDFRSLSAGEYLYMQGHAGLYLGPGVFGPHYNVVECTVCWGQSGVIASWVDPDGTRRNIKNGQPVGVWQAHGILSKYITYNRKKSLKEVAQEVIAGKWGNFPERKKLLTDAGYNYSEVQAAVNKILKKKTNLQIAKEVIAGKWGVNPERKQKLLKAGYDYDTIQKMVNKILSK